MWSESFFSSTHHVHPLSRECSSFHSFIDRIASFAPKPFIVALCVTHSRKTVHQIALLSREENKKTCYNNEQWLEHSIHCLHMLAKSSPWAAAVRFFSFWVCYRFVVVVYPTMQWVIGLVACIGRTHSLARSNSLFHNYVRSTHIGMLLSTCRGIQR